MMFNRYYWATFVITELYGIGSGAWTSVEFAMLMDILPDPETYARDVSIWHTAVLLPGLAAAPVGGLLLDFATVKGAELRIECFGYQVTFGSTIVYTVVGVGLTYMLRKIK